MIKIFFRVFCALSLLLLGVIEAYSNNGNFSGNTEAASALQIVVNGTVTSGSDNQPLPGVNVIEKGTQNGTVTDVNGKFSISVTNADAILSFSFIGFLSEEVQVGNQTSLNVVLVEDIQTINEVVVVGYGTSKKTDLTGSVAVVNSEELTQLATTNVQQALQGRASGVMIVSESGEPGSGAKVRIRGIGTINRSNPLYVVDGFPVSDINYLSPGDIESINVLKDASATAIYGNRGANGVVLVTTKKGKTEKTNVSFNMYTGVQNISKKIDVLNAEEYAMAKIEAYNNSGDSLFKTNPTNYKVFNYVIDNHLKGTDWQDAILQHGSLQNYNMTINGGGDKYKYFISGTYDKEDGIIKNSWNKKYFFRMNNAFEFAKWINAEVNLAYTRGEKTNYDYGDYSSPLVLALLAVPITPVFDQENVTDLNPKGYSYASYNARANPVAGVDRMKNGISKNNMFITNFGLNLKPLEGLTITSRFGASLIYRTPRSFNPTYYIGTKDEHSAVADLYEQFERDYDWTMSNFANYTRTMGSHTVNLMAGQEMSYFSWDRSNLRAYGISEDPNLQYVGAASNIQPPTVGGDVGESALYSYFGRVNYTYADKYLVTVNIRRDGSSKISEDYRWGTFPSFSLGWKISEESFLQSIEAINFLKIRAGMGTTGNESSVEDPYSLYATIEDNMWMVAPDKTKIPGAIQTTTPNSKLQWETVKQYNIGLDYGFFRNKLSGTIDYFIKNTEDMIVDNQPPLFNGMRASRFNFGAMENKGVELSMLYQQTIGEFSFDLGGNITFLSKPIVTKLATPDYVYDAGSSAKVSNICRTRQGEEFAYFNGYQTDGLLSQSDIDNTFEVIDNDTVYTYAKFKVGDPKLVDQNNDGVFTADSDKVNLGSANPDFFYGINMAMSYKGFDLKVFFQGVKGFELVNGITSWLNVPNQGDDNLSKDVLNSYGFNGNTNTSVPRLVQGNTIFHTYFNDMYVQNASYFRMKNIQIGYTLPKSMLESVKITNCRIYLSAENLLTITKYKGFDPEVGRSNGGTLAPGLDMATYPVSRRFLIGINLNF